jgi:hypothetical protein
MHIQPRRLRQPANESINVSSTTGMWQEAVTSSTVVTLCLDDATVTEAELRDVTPTGFRIYYRGTALPLGLEVVILYPWGKVNALVTSVVPFPSGAEVDFLITG